MKTLLLIIIAMQMGLVVGELGEISRKLDKPALAPGVYRSKY